MVEERLPKVEILVSPVYDLLTGLALVGNHSKACAADVDPISGLLNQEVTEKIRARLRPRLLANIDQFFDEGCYPGLGLVSVVNDWSATDVPSFLQVLYQRPLTEFTRAMLSFGKIYRGNRLFGHTIEELMSDRQVLVEHIEQNMSVPTEKVNLLADMVMHPEETRDNLAELLEHFWYVILLPEAEKRAQLQAQLAEQTRLKMDELGLQRFLMGITDMYMSEGSDSYDEVVLAPSTYYGHGILGNENSAETSLILVYGPELKFLKQVKEAVEGEEPLSLETLSTLYNVLGDETRLQIVQALVERPYYGQELAKMFKVSNATVFYHLSLLMKTAAVHLERIEHRVYYVLDTEQLRHTLERANIFLLGSDK
jgi:DNA-binding transcriptional ArsR family regulator